MKRARATRRERARASQRADRTTASADATTTAEAPPNAQPAAATCPPADRAITRAAWWLLFVAALATALFIRVRLLDVPLERDEGEYAYAGQLILQGEPPYKHAYNMKLPGTYAAYAVLMAVFGQTTRGVHLGLLLVNAATIAILFFIGKRLLGLPGGIAAASTYALLSVSPAVLGFAGHATHFIVLPVLGAMLLLIRPATGKLVIFAAGVLLGLGVLMKQAGVFFIPFGLAILCLRDWRAEMRLPHIASRLLILLAGVALPLGLTSLLLWSAGVFDKFWFWTVVYASEYGTAVSLSRGFEVFQKAIKGVVAPAWLVWLLAALGAIACASSKSLRASAPVLASLFICAALAVAPGLYFRPHYFILLLPAVCLLAGAAVAWLANLRSPFASPAVCFVFAVVLTSTLYAERTFLFKLDPVAASRSIYGTNPFPESERIGAFLRERTGPDDRIVVMGSEPQIFFHAQRRSATGYIYVYSLMETQPLAQQMHREFIAEAEAANPKYLVLVAIDASWLGHARSEKLVYQWMGDYMQRNFRLVGFADIVSMERTEYYLPATPGTKPTSRQSVMIYERI